MGPRGRRGLVPGARLFVSKPTRAEKAAEAAARAATAQAEMAAAVSGPSPDETAAVGWLDRGILALPYAGLFVVAAFALRRLDDFDTWWHLASGRWIAQHASVPHVDVLSFTVPQNEWINLQWLYDLLLYAFWNLGGASLLVIVSASCFVLTFAILAKHLGRFVGSITMTLLLGWVAMTVNERFLIRPEMATFPLLAAVQLVLTDGRRDPRRLRWLVPLMLVWANMHSLFILGLGAIACTISASFAAELALMPVGWRRDGTWPSAARAELLKWGGAALAATLVNPYFARALTFPFELMSRIDGSSPIYGVIGEFRRPFSGYFLTFALGSYQMFVFAAAGLALAAGLVRALAKPVDRRDDAKHEYSPQLPPEQPRVAVPADQYPLHGGQQSEGFDVGALLFAVVLGYLSLLARRNVGVFAIGAVPFVGACAGILIARFPKSWTARHGPAVRAMTLVTLAGVAVVCTMVVSNRWYASTGETHEFGLGVFGSNFQPRATAFFREQKLPGPMYNDMTAGGYLTFDDPTGKGVYVDGRLEVYDTPFFGAYLDNLGNYAAWRKDADARGIQSAMLFHRWGNRQTLLRQMVGSGQWKIVYYDEVVALVVRVAGNESVIVAAQAAFSGKAYDETTRLLEGPTQTASWQWAIDRFTAQQAYSTLLRTIGDNDGAMRWLEASLKTGLPPVFAVDAQQRLAQDYVAKGNFAQARQRLQAAQDLDPANEETRGMLGRLDEISH